MRDLFLYVAASAVFLVGTSGTLYRWLTSGEAIQTFFAYVCIVVVLGAFIRAACEVFEITE